MAKHKTLKIIKKTSADKTKKFLKIRKLGKTRKNKQKLSHIFKNNDFTSGDGMLTSVWGPSFWHVLHTISFNYPVEPTKTDKMNYKKFVLQLKYILPCKYCRINFRKNLKQMPLHMKHMKSRDTFSRYMYELHELINKMLNKKSGLTYDDVRQRYEHFRARCGKKIEVEKLLITNKQTKKHKGCVQPLHKIKSKGVVNIVPHNTKCDSISIDTKCFDVVN